jgi:flagellar basal-body rod protein FlgC
MKPVIIGFVIAAMASVLSFASGSDAAMKTSAQGLLIQKERLKLIAENVANATTLKTASGKPYQKKMLFVSTSKSGATSMKVVQSSAPFSQIYDPENPAADKNGFVNLPNVNLPQEMVDLGYTNILYEANATAYKSAKAMNQQVIDLLR